LSRGAHEREGLLVLLATRRLAHEHELGLRVSLTEDDVRAALRELAPRAALQESRERAEVRRRPRGHRCGRRGFGSVDEEVLDAEVAKVFEIGSAVVDPHPRSLAR